MKQLLAIAILGMLLTGCGKSVDSKSKTFTYPLALGNQWTYQIVGTHEYGDPLVVETTWTAAMTVTVKQVDTIPPGVPRYKVLTAVAYSDSSQNTYADHYLNLPDGLYLFLMKEGLGIIHSDRRSPGAEWLAALPDPKGLTAAQVANLADTLPLVLPYPQHSGMLWTYHDSGGAWEYRVDKLIEGRETITTPAGSFDCWRIHNIYGEPWEDLRSWGYVSAEGVIRSRSALRFSTGDWIDTYDLVSVTLY